jgi:predicted NBD/HSP70 family sugar kinase
MPERPLVGVDVGGTKVCILVQLGDKTAVVKRFPSGLATDGHALSAFIADVINSLGEPPAAVGIAIPGLVSDGVVVISDVLPLLAGWRPAASIEQRCSVTVLNDAEAALVELTSDMEKGATAAVVMVGTGIGAALLLDGRIFRGARGWAGELGSMPLGSGNPVVTLDSRASGAAIMRALNLDPEVALARMTAGDPVALGVVREAGQALGIGLATLINLLNPTRIVVGGGVLRYPGYLDAALGSAKNLALPQLEEVCSIVEAENSDTLVARGAARAAKKAMT